jgi:hypothetical protein
MTPSVSSKGFGRPATASLDSVCSQGRAVGWQKATATNAGLSYVTDVNGAASTLTRWNVYGLDGAATGEAFCVGTDGTIIFSMSPKAVFTGTTNYGYKAVFDATFPVPATQLSTNLLSNFPDTTGSTNLVTPYGCTPDGTYAVGMS